MDIQGLIAKRLWRPPLTNAYSAFLMLERVDGILIDSEAVRALQVK